MEEGITNDARRELDPMEKLKTAKKAPLAYRMVGKLLTDLFFTGELKTCTCVPVKPGGRVVREQAWL